ncbi:protein-methionine-sulfoxide reductase catalytic subunit MsrP [Allopusillimonas ginsengisoli]|uniref:protein-methionine-sulfoxide reductase catalytic subunit MsrP n=1 Tax=Allopusillimonas ginsengisoli TaxID=453575 RepID=UPI0010C22534|nr:protein-methionine-sulfoxide reductase catalytic subunit MsrP [Allopusillimonas ginsengisoli]
MSKVKVPYVASSEITPEFVWQSRRRWLQQAGFGVAAALAGNAFGLRDAMSATLPPSLPNSKYQLDAKLTSEKDITTYNNFYEFGTDKSDPSRYAGAMQTEPWTVSIEGEVEHPGVYDMDGLLKLASMEERVYRLRCVEAWSMVIPWQGYSLATLLKKVGPTSKAKYVEFVTAEQPKNMRGISAHILDWPYVEALRIDEAMHPLTLLTFGLYGKSLPNQNGAPVRVVVPWKYGFKSGKSIVKIRLTEQQPVTSWVKIAPSEYGFYGNVNPQVPHPRWSQATERRIGAGVFAPRAETLMFNGYADQVASLYTGMDLKRNF